MNMIERVALAICGSDDPDNILTIHRIRARLAIEAMREPTDKMMVEMEEAAPELMCFSEKENSPSYKAWQAGIDAALKE